MTKHISFLKQHKKAVIFIFACLLIFSGYSIRKGSSSGSGEIRYMTSQVKKGALSVSVSGIGQVLATKEFDIKSSASGDLIMLDMENGQDIKKGKLIAKIDDVMARRQVRDAAIDLESARLAMNKLMEPPADLEIERAENEIVRSKNSLKQLEYDYDTQKNAILNEVKDLENDLPVKYAEAFNNITNIFISLPSILADMNSVIDGHDFSPTQTNLAYYNNYLKNKDEIGAQKAKVEQSYKKARGIYDEGMKMYQETARSDTEKLEELTDKTYETVDAIAQALKDFNVFLTLVYDEMSNKQSSALVVLNGHINIISSSISDINPYLTSIFNDVREIDEIKKSIEEQNAEFENIAGKFELNKADQELSIREKENDLIELKAGADELDIREKQIQIDQKKNSLADADRDLADYSMYMPFDGMVTEVQAEKDGTVSSSSVIASIISNNKMSEITLNEIDIVKVEIGQKAVLTFDAIDDFTITGSVIEMDSVGTVEQGVVNYNVRISFDIDDERIRPGMSVNAELISESSHNTLLVPNSAVKTENGESYAEILQDGMPVRKTVEIGIANDTVTEIISGLKEGDEVITGTLNQLSSLNNTNNNNSGTRPPDNMFRMMR